MVQISKKIYLAATAFVLLCGCAKKEPPQTPPLLQLRQIGQLATAEMEVSKVVRARDEDTWYKLGERRMLITCRARIKAGVNLEQLKETDVVQQGGSIRIKLPLPQIISFSMPPEAIRVSYTDIGHFRDPFSQTETNAIMKQAESQIRRQADSLDILARAKAGAVTFITRFFVQAGFEEVIVE
ncbi:DUF4230 domain-containing protein [Pseudocnuella soli]|uniref:DUF4230 domain-containing protein n=1 Tax=Pseudocnuella soli TaxID=2502779 RepID=UPI00104B7AA6|nr:DUF4230 domain-containing protein [Pseudocnuella soli]